ncbi:MAG TPA: DUF4258 domain-containing protein [Anaerolineales bacterium]|nr:DUF4258 domain-containing protein [Anaerolineales bacterium]
MNKPRTLFRIHAVQRMFERNISLKRVHQAIQSGEIIEDYSTEMPEPSRLLLGFQGRRPFHVVMSENPKTSDVTVITVYLPDRAKWDKNARSRRS